MEQEYEKHPEIQALEKNNEKIMSVCPSAKIAIFLLKTLDELCMFNHLLIVNLKNGLF